MGKEGGCEKGKPCPDGMVFKDGECVMPKVSFETFIVSLNTTALFHLGELADPATGKKQKDFVLARHTVDTLKLLEDKTKGNLTETEKNLLQTVLHDLQLRFVMTKN